MYSRTTLKICKFVIYFTVNATCVLFVAVKSTECLLKFLENPIGTKLEVKDSMETDNFPSITICATNNTDRWNATHLNICEIER